jgi:hypothetical protein
MPMTAEPLTRQWEQLCRDLEHPAVELTVEEFAALLSVYKLLLADGHQFDCGTRALMAVLEREAKETDDGFEDDTDSDYENENPDDDGCATALDFFADDPSPRGG